MPITGSTDHYRKVRSESRRAAASKGMYVDEVESHQSARPRSDNNLQITATAVVLVLIVHFAHLLVQLVLRFEERMGGHFLHSDV